MRLVENKVSEFKKGETLYLWWANKKEGKKHPAGVAFYDDTYSEYRLKIDVFPSSSFYLRPIGTDNGAILYRIEIVHKNNDGEFKRRACVGTGRGDDKEIVATFFAFNKPLILSFLKKGDL